MRTVPLIQPDLPAFEEVADQFREIMASGRITNFGPYVTRFEQEIGRYVGAHAATTSSGTMGLLFTLQALGLEQGAKVIVPSFTFMATAQAVVYAGGRPIYAEVGDDLLIDPADLAALLEQHPDTALILPVHMYGLPCDASTIQRIAGDRKVVYDAAHAFGSERDGVRVGAAGAAEVFSLSVTKVLVSVEGGVVTSRNAQLIERIRHMRNYGIEANYNAWYPGLNGKMSEFHAIIGLANLGRTAERMERRQQIAREYSALVHEQSGCRVLPTPPNVLHTYKDFTVLLPEALVARRDQVIARLKELGVETRAYFYPPVHEQQLFARFADRPLPRTERLARRVLTLPFYTTMTGEDMTHVAAALGQVERELT